MGTFVVFRIASQRYAIPVDKVDAVVAMAWVTVVADSPADVCGLVDVHGRLVAVVDPAPRLSAPRVAPSAKDFLLLLSRACGEVALKVDEIDDLATAEVRSSPPEVEAPAFVVGHLQGAGALVSVLDVDRLLRPEVRTLAATVHREPGS